MIPASEYKQGLSFEQSENLYSQARREFEKISEGYPKKSFLGIRRRIRAEDLREVTNCFGVLLQLGLEDSVQKQILETANITDTLHHKISDLTYRIMNFAADFRNSGVRRLKYELVF